MGISRKVFELAKSPLGSLIVGIAFSNFSTILPVNKIIETKKAIAFYHPSPSYKIHILIVPKKRIKDISALNEKNSKYIVEVYSIAKQIVKDLGLKEKGYSLIVNGGTKQDIPQLHFHLISD